MGLDVLHPHPTSARSGHLTVDIVAVHGLNGDAIRTWTETRSKKLWLQDFLPASIEGGTRVMSFRYNAAAAFGNTTATVRDYASDLLGSLVARRANVNETARPIVFVAHSLGGIIVKQALILAQTEAEYQGIKTHTKGIFFFATPHKGSNFANYGAVLAKLATRLLNRPNPMLLNALETNSKTLLDLTAQFTALAPNFQIATFYELKPMGVFRSLIVEKNSAILGVEGEAPQAVTADHVGICRFGSRDDETYVKLISRLHRMLSNEAIAHTNTEALNLSRHPESCNKFYEIPHRVSSLFTGRDDISSKLRAKCLPTESQIKQKEQKVFVLYGLGGIGKTQICLKFAQDHRESFWGIFFVDVSSTSTAEQSFSRLAHSCQIGDDQEAFTKWLATRTEHWLLVLDNADNRSLDISPYFPTGARGTIIITTRNPLHDLYKTVGGGSARVDKMDSDEATTLLLKASDTDGNDQSFRSRAQPLIQLLGYLPLAIIPAGALIRQGKYTPEEYCEAFAHRRKELLSSQSLQASTDYNYTVYTTWEVSITAIKESARGEAGVSQSDSADAANALELLNVFAFCHHDDISEEILQEAWDFVPHVWNNHWWMSNIIRILRENRSPTWDPLPFRQAIDLLSNYSLIYLTNRRIALHPLVQSCIRDRLDDKSNPDDGSVLQWWTTTLIMLALAAKTKDEGVVQRQRLLGPHIDTCLKTRDIGDFLVEDDSAAERVDVVHRFITYDSRGVVLEDRLLLAQRALGYCDKMLDENDPRLWQFLDSTACLANDMGRWQTTVDLLETKVTTYLDTHTSDSEYPRESLQAMERLIIAYNRGCRTQEALELAEKVLKVCSDSPGDHVLIASYIEEILAAIYNDLGRKEDAQRTAQIACSKMEAVLGENNPRCVRSKGRLADQYIRTGDSQKAIDMYQQILKWRKTNLSENHHDTLDAQAVLVKLYIDLDRPQDGIPLIVDVLEKGEKSGEQAWYMQGWRSLLETLRAMEAEKLSRGMEGPARKDDGMEHEGLTSAGERPSAVDKRKFRSWAKKTFRRE